jgi:hypothetical protein
MARTLSVVVVLGLTLTLSTSVMVATQPMIKLSIASGQWAYGCFTFEGSARSVARGRILVQRSAS